MRAVGEGVSTSRGRDAFAEANLPHRHPGLAAGGVEVDPRVPASVGAKAFVKHHATRNSLSIEEDFDFKLVAHGPYVSADLRVHHAEIDAAMITAESAQILVN